MPYQNTTCMNMMLCSCIDDSILVIYCKPSANQLH